LEQALGLKQAGGRSGVRGLASLLIDLGELRLREKKPEDAARLFSQAIEEATRTEGAQAPDTVRAARLLRQQQGPITSSQPADPGPRRRQD